MKTNRLYIVALLTAATINMHATLSKFDPTLWLTQQAVGLTEKGIEAYLGGTPNFWDGPKGDTGVKKEVLTWGPVVLKTVTTLVLVGKAWNSQSGKKVRNNVTNWKNGTAGTSSTTPRPESNFGDQDNEYFSRESVAFNKIARLEDLLLGQRDESGTRDESGLAARVFEQDRLLFGRFNVNGELVEQGLLDEIKKLQHNHGELLRVLADQNFIRVERNEDELNRLSREAAALTAHLQQQQFPGADFTASATGRHDQALQPGDPGFVAQQRTIFNPDNASNMIHNRSASQNSQN